MAALNINNTSQAYSMRFWYFADLLLLKQRCRMIEEDCAEHALVSCCADMKSLPELSSHPPGQAGSPIGLGHPHPLRIPFTHINTHQAEDGVGDQSRGNNYQVLHDSGMTPALPPDQAPEMTMPTLESQGQSVCLPWV